MVSPGRFITAVRSTIWTLSSSSSRMGCLARKFSFCRAQQFNISLKWNHYPPFRGVARCAMIERITCCGRGGGLFMYHMSITLPLAKRVIHRPLIWTGHVTLHRLLNNLKDGTRGMWDLLPPPPPWPHTRHLYQLFISFNLSEYHHFC